MSAKRLRRYVKQSTFGMFSLGIDFFDRIIAFTTLYVVQRLMFLAQPGLIEPFYFLKLTLLTRYRSNGSTDFHELLHERVFTVCDDPQTFWF